MDKKLLNESELENVSGGISEIDESTIEFENEIELEKRRALEKQLKAMGLSDEEIMEILKGTNGNEPMHNPHNPIIF